MVLVFDFDQTIADTSKALHDVYKIETGSNDKFNPNHKWDFDGLFPKSYHERGFKLFTEKILFDNLKAFPNCIEVLERLSKKHDIYIATKHTADGIPFKDAWIRKHIPFAHVVYLDTFNKGILSGDVFVDDKPECLNSVNGKFNHILCFGTYDWNNSYTNKRILNWIELENYINNI